MTLIQGSKVYRINSFVGDLELRSPAGLPIRIDYFETGILN